MIRIDHLLGLYHYCVHSATAECAHDWILLLRRGWTRDLVYLRFALSYRDVEGLLAERGLDLIWSARHPMDPFRNMVEG